MYNISIEKYKDMLKNTVFAQNHYSKTAEGIYKVRHHSIRSMKGLAYYNQSYYENIYSYNLMASLLKYLNEIS